NATVAHRATVIRGGTMRKGTRSNPLVRRWRGNVWIAVAVLCVPMCARAEMRPRAAKKPATQARDTTSANIVQILGRYGVRPDQVFTWYGAPRPDNSVEPCVPLTRPSFGGQRPLARVLSQPPTRAVEQQPVPSDERPRYELVGA